MLQHDNANTRPPLDLSWPFGTLDGLDPDDISMTAYEIFFTSCRSSPGFGGRNAIQFYSPGISGGDNGSGASAKAGGHGVGMAVTSKIKRALGLRMLKQSHSSRRSNSCGTNPLSPGGHHGNSNPGIGFSTVPGRSKRPLTSAEIMRQQMKVPEASDNRLRKTLMRTLVGQMGRRAETIILPLELIRHLKPSEFNDSNEYHIWQKRQLKILEAGLLLHPSNPLDKSDCFAMCLRDVIRSCDVKPIDTGKNSETMRNLCNSVVTLAWRSADGCPTDVCHWADGFPFNVNLYAALLHSIFDSKDPTSILDEVDELLELIKKTWSTFGINKPMHDLCLTWVLFEQYITTGQVEDDLLSASMTMLTEVANDSKKVDREPVYVKMLSSVLTSMTRWCEKQLLDYHESFNKETIGVMEHILPLVFSATRILEEDVPGYEPAATEKGDVTSDSAGSKVDQYTRSSLQKAFTRMVGNRNVIHRSTPLQQVCETLVRLANETEELAFKEKDTFCVVLKRWNPVSVGVGALTLHSCYGTVLKQFLSCNYDISHEMLTVLQRADKLEKVLVNMVVEDSVECDDGGKNVVREMVPYEVDSIIVKFLKQSIGGRLKKIREVVHRAKESETWNPKSKTEPYAQSAVDLLKQARDLLVSFFEIPIAISETMVEDFADGVERILRDYTTFVASCGTKQNYIPALPPLTRCSRGSKLAKLWKKATPCAVAGLSPYHLGLEEGNHPRPSTSRGTQRLYIRLNTLHYLISQLCSLDKCFAHTKIIPSHKNRSSSSRRHVGGPHFEQARSSIMAATHHLSEVAAYRLIFLDSNSVFYGSLYIGHVVNARISPALRVLQQNLTLLSAIVTERAQPLAIIEVMKASFEAYLMVLIAGGGTRCFTRIDHEMIEDDFRHLKRVFTTYEDGVIQEDEVEKEAETVEGVVALMGKSTEDLIDDFTVVACEASGIGVSSGQTLPMPPTTGRWSSSDPNTMLRVFVP